MNEEENYNTKYYVPICREIGCGGILKIKFNEYDFSIDYECIKNEVHKAKKIFFKTFERFYLKEKQFNICNQCSISIENEIIFKCKKCGKAYCSNCFIKDKHIKKNIKNLTQISKKYPTHNKNLDYYCFDCKKNICIYCINNADNHKNHKNVYIMDVMLSNKQINNLKNKIKQKSEYINELIESISNWEKKCNIK